MGKLVGALLVAGFFFWILLAVALYVYGLYLASLFGSAAIVLLSFVPLVGQVYLIWSIWGATGTFFSTYTIAILSWIALGVLLGNVVQRR